METLKSPKLLLDSTPTERRKFLDSFDTVMVDFDGCIWSLLQPIPGAGQGLKALEEKLNKKIIYVSNNSVRSVESVRVQLESQGLKFQEGNLVNSVIAIAHYLHTKKFEGLIYVIGSLEMRNRLQAEGFNVIFGVSVTLRDPISGVVIRM